MGRTIFVGGPYQDAVWKCRELGLNPRSREVIIATSSYDLKGLRLNADDRVLYGRDCTLAMHEEMRRLKLRLEFGC